MRDFELKEDGPGFWAVLRQGRPVGYITKGVDRIYRACRHSDGQLTRHADFPAALMELVQ